MSTTIVVDIHTKIIDIFLKVGTVQENLADFVRRIRNEKRLSTPDVERLSNFKITDGYVSRIENNGVKNVSPEKLSALAKGLGVTEEEIFAVVRGRNPNEQSKTEERFRLLGKKFNDLDEEYKTKIEFLVEILEREIARATKEI
jgi:transcriptional regulator with XRE-family HTH domain